MRAVEVVFAVGWVAFWVYWLVAAFSMKRGRVPWGREVAVRVLVAVIVLVLVRVGAFRHDVHHADPWLAALGLVLFAAGLGLAVWARLHIGRNWGMPMTERDQPELVTSGPYRLVRHPIYTGLLLGLVGTAVALDWTWLIAAALAGSYFVYAAITEERYLVRVFPESYPRYKSTTRMLIPFLV